MKKGFTLAELLGVIVILGIIALITTPIVTTTVRNSEEKAYEKQIDVIETAAKQWGVENTDSLPDVSSGKKKIITLNNLIESGKIENEKIIDPRTDGEMNGCVVVKYNSEYNQYEYNYEEDSSKCQEKTPFAEDDWSTIIKNVQSGKGNLYKVGEEKELTLSGTVTGTYTVRLANNSTPSECSSTVFSQTACGFVIEFKDIISKRSFNSSYTTKGGWRDSSMRTYVNSDIYNSIPSEIKNSIIDTYVVSGYGSEDTTNFTTTDKLYLLSAKEVYGKEGTTNVSDTSDSSTRQLDYYTNIDITNDNYSAFIKKINETPYYWVLRTVKSDSYVHVVSYTSGKITEGGITTSWGVSPAFRIG